MFARAVLKFDLSNIPGLPSNANIIEISFSIYFLEGDTGVEGSLCSLFVISKYWNSTEVTWNNATKTDKWEQLDLDTKFYDWGLQDTVQFPGGGDRIFPCAATAPLANENNRLETYTITEVMQKYIKNPGTFYGLYLKPYMGNGGRWYASSKYAEQDKRPKLTIKYSGTDISLNHLPEITSQKLIKITPKMVHVHIPLNNQYLVTILDLKGRTIYSFNGYGKKWYHVPKTKLNNGMNILCITNSHSKIIQNFLVVK